MLFSNGSRVAITGKYAYDRDIVVDWDDRPGADRYKVVLHRADSPKNRAVADASASESHYRFTGLEPSTAYTVRVGVRGDDSTQSSVNATTLPDGTAPLPSGLFLDASLRPRSDRIDLRWDDTNGVGRDGRYLVEVSVDGGPFEPAGARRGVPGAEYAVRPAWLGSELAYRVHERAGPQEFSSNNASVRIPASLEAPSNLTVGRAGAGGAAGGNSSGISLSLRWDHSPLFRHYVVELQAADGSWERLGRTPDNSFAYSPEPGDGRGEYAFRVYAQLNTALSPPSGTSTYGGPAPPPEGGVSGGV